MTAMDKPLAGAPPTCFENWGQINWTLVEKEVQRLQVRIAKATSTTDLKFVPN